MLPKFRNEDIARFRRYMKFNQIKGIDISGSKDQGKDVGYVKSSSPYEFHISHILAIAKVTYATLNIA